MLNAVRKQEGFHTVELLFLKLKKTHLKKPTKRHSFFCSVLKCICLIIIIPDFNGTEFSATESRVVIKTRNLNKKKLMKSCLMRSGLASGSVKYPQHTLAERIST